MKPTILTLCAVAMATLVVSGAQAQTDCDVPAECELIAQDNSSVSIDTSPGVCVLVKTLDFNLDSTSNLFVVFDLGHSHGCCHHDSLVFQLDLDGETIFGAELPFFAGAPSGCENTTADCTFLGDVAAGDHTIEIFLCDEGQNCILEVYACPAVGAPVDLDIKPGSCPNSFNRNSNGVLPVALVGTDTFDVMDVDTSTLLLTRADGMAGSVAPLDGPPGPGLEFEDVATPFDGELCDCHEETGDGITDLSLKFKTQDTVSALQLDEFDPGALVELCLSGETTDGEEFEACDCVRLVPPGTPPGLLSVQSNMPSVFIEASPLDEQLDSGGFGSFQRTYPLGTFVTLTAPSSYWGIPFAGWQVNDNNLHAIGPPLVPSLSILLFVIDSEQSVKAIYGNRRTSFDAAGPQNFAQ